MLCAFWRYQNFHTLRCTDQSADLHLYRIGTNPAVGQDWIDFPDPRIRHFKDRQQKQSATLPVRRNRFAILYVNIESIYIERYGDTCMKSWFSEMSRAITSTLHPVEILKLSLYFSLDSITLYLQSCKLMW